MRVLHAISSLDRAAGGPVAALLGLVKAQVKLGFEVDVLSSCDEASHIAAELTDGGATVSLISTGRPLTWPSLRCIRAAYSLVRKVEVIHIHGLWEFLPTVVAAAASEASIPYVVRPCGMLDGWSLAQNYLAKKVHLAAITRPLLNRATVIHATTDRERNELLKLRLRPEILVVANGVDEAAFDDSVYVPPEDLELLKRSRRLVLFLGRVRSQKGIDILIAAMQQVQTRGVLLVIVGPCADNYCQEVRQQIEHLGLAGSIYFMDPVYGSDRFAAYDMAELYVLPSEHENFGITVAEAMA